MDAHTRRFATVAAGGLALLILVAAAAGEVRSPWVSTDRTVDCSSYETILRDVLKKGMTDEQKAIALYDFYRQMVYHYRNLPESRDPIKCINVMGNTLCGSQATCMKGLLEAAGLKTRVVSHPGHTFYEVFYDGKWHGYDTMMNFYVFTRGPDRHVASFAELHADPTLISDAVKEGRACPGLCPCGDKPMAFARKTHVLNYKPLKTGWSVKDYALRRGEEIVRPWWPHGRPLPGSYRRRDPGPMHTCGWRDRKNPPRLFRFWEPYGIPGFGGVSISYRHYFNGWMTYSPDPAWDQIAKPLAAGELVIPVKCPYYITAANVVFEATCTGAGDAVDVGVSVGKDWTPILSAEKPGTHQYRASLDRVVVRPYRGRHTYRLRFRRKGKAVLKRFCLKTVFVHNAMASPHLMPGRNVVTVTAAEKRLAPAEALTVIYRYKAAPEWVDLKTVERTATALPLTFTVELPQTKKLPQMQDLTLRCGKLFWRPAAKAAPDRVLCDFADPQVVSKWHCDPEMKLSHDGVGMLITVAGKATYPQASLAGLKEDWSQYRNVVIELENLGSAVQQVVFRVRSNENNAQRTDVNLRARPGKSVHRIPVAGLTKTKVNAITKIYLMTYQVPKTGCRIRVRKIYLEAKQPL